MAYNLATYTYFQSGSHSEISSSVMRGQCPPRVAAVLLLIFGLAAGHQAAKMGTCPEGLLSASDWSDRLLAGRTCAKLKPAQFGHVSAVDLSRGGDPLDPVRDQMTDLLVGLNAEVFASAVTAGFALDGEGHRLKISQAY